MLENERIRAWAVKGATARLTELEAEVEAIRATFPEIATERKRQQAAKARAVLAQKRAEKKAEKEERPGNGKRKKK